MRYDGPVTILLGQNIEVQAEGTFHTSQRGNLKSWEGEITSDDFAGLTRAMQISNLSILLPSGRTGKVVAQNLSGPVADGFVLTVLGSGPPPF